MKKKWIYGVMAIMILSLAGCGEEDAEITGTDTQDETTYVYEAGISENEMPENAASENVISENFMPNDAVSDNTVTEDVSMEEEIEEEVYIPIESISNCLYFANMSGKDLESLTITFSAGTLQGREILGEDDLPDGELFTFVIEDMLSLRNAENLTLSVNAVAADDTVMNFTEIRIIDPAQMTIVLTSGEEGYEMYVR